VAPLSVVNSHGTFTGKAMQIGTTTAAGTGFDMVNAKANSVEVYRVLGDGSTKQAKGATIDAGGLVVTLGGATVSAAGLTVTGGATVATAGLDVTGGQTITTGGLKIDAGGATVQDTGLKVTAGGATVTLGGLSVVDSGTTLTTTAALVAPLKASNSHSTFTGDVAQLTTTSTGTGFDMIDASAGGSSVYRVLGDGSTKQAKGATVDSGGLKVTTGGATVTAGGLKVVDAGTTLITTAAAVAPLSVVNSHGTFTGKAMQIGTTTGAGTGFDMVNAMANCV
jgi:hypothetical protein